MPNTTRQELLRFWEQGNNDLDRYLANCQNMIDIYSAANERFQGRYEDFVNTIVLFSQMTINQQQLWQAFRDEKL